MVTTRGWHVLKLAETCSCLVTPLVAVVPPRNPHVLPGKLRVKSYSTGSHCWFSLNTASVGPPLLLLYNSIAIQPVQLLP